jgi:hypothetical protein
LEGQELKVKNHKLVIGFNNPGDKAGTTFDFNVLMGSKNH